MEKTTQKKPSQLLQHQTLRGGNCLVTEQQQADLFTDYSHDKLLFIFSLEMIRPVVCGSQKWFHTLAAETDSQTVWPVVQ